MPHQCTECGRTFADGSKEMLSGCPDCGGNKFQFMPDRDDAGDAGTDAAEPGSGSPDASDPVGPESTGSAGADDAASAAGTAGPDSSGSAGESVARKVGTAAATVRDMVGGDGAGANRENTAQADARSQVVSREELPESEVEPPDQGVEQPADPPAGPGANGAAAPDAGADAPGSAAGTPDATADGPETAASAPEATADAPEADRDAVETPDVERTDRPDLKELREELNDQFESIRVVAPGQYELNLMELYDREEYIIALQEDGRYSIQVPGSWRDE